MTMGDPWGIGGFREGDSQYQANRQKKSEKATKSEKNSKLKKSDIFFY